MSCVLNVLTYKCCKFAKLNLYCHNNNRIKHHFYTNLISTSLL